jgi:hypothetical protein
MPMNRNVKANQVCEDWTVIFLQSVLPEKPILIRQSIGELAVHKLTTINKGVAGICTHPSHGLKNGLGRFNWTHEYI